ncbi:hypothetical protein GCM10009077_43800 [Roseibium denhamense]
MQNLSKRCRYTTNDADLYRYQQNAGVIRSHASNQPALPHRQARDLLTGGGRQLLQSELIT